LKPDENEQEIRISHLLCRGFAEAEDWIWKVRGLGGGNKASQRAKDHWKNARKFGYKSVIERCKMDFWYRETLNEHGWDLLKVIEFEKFGNPEWREAAKLQKPMSRQERTDAGFGSYRPIADYRDQDQGGHDTNYKQKKPKGSGKGSGEKKQVHFEEPYQTTDAYWKEGWPEGTRAERPEGTRAEQSSGSWQQWYEDTDHYWGSQWSYGYW